MFKKFKPISISLSPNIQNDDVVLTIKTFFKFKKWKTGEEIKKLENQFKNYLNIKFAFSFNSGRSALFAILKALDLNKNSEILLQAFTCNAVPNPVLWLGLKPIYVDCDNFFNVNISDLKKKITKNSKVFIIQHTFGLPANINKVIPIMRQNNIIIIEDCAHALGSQINGKKTGTFGDAAFFSFSRDKVISCVYGGIAVTNNYKLAKKLEKLQKDFGQPSLFWIKQQLLHPILLHYFILPLYKFLNLGKIFLILFQLTCLLSKAVSWKEKRGLKPNYFPKALPNGLAILAINQFNKLEKFNNHRKEIANFYYKELAKTTFILPQKENNIFLRFAVQHPKAHEIIYQAWHKENILLGDWYRTPVDPFDTNLKDLNYEKGMCFNAERLSKITLNLPTHINISIKDAERITEFLKKWK